MHAPGSNPGLLPTSKNWLFWAVVSICQRLLHRTLSSLFAGVLDDLLVCKFVAGKYVPEKLFPLGRRGT